MATPDPPHDRSTAEDHPTNVEVGAEVSIDADFDEVMQATIDAVP